MARAKDILLRFVVDDKQKSKLAGIGTEAGKTQSKFSQLTGGAKALVAGFAAVVGTKIVSFLGDAASAAAEDQKAQDLLALAIKNSTDATQLDITATEDWIKQTSLASGVADDELRPALGNLVRATGDLEEAQDLLSVAMDISAAKGIPVETIATAIGKAAGGAVGPLGRLGIAIKDADGKTLSFEDAMAEAARTMGGATAAAADTVEGKMRRLKVAADETKESFGAALLPVLGDMAESASDLGNIVGFLTEKVSDLTGSSTNLWDIWTTMTGLNFFTGLFSDISDQIDKLNQEQIDANKTLAVGADRYDDMTTSIEETTKALEDQNDEIRSQLDPMFNLIDKVNDLSRAQTASGEARDKYGEGSPEHLEALRKEAGAFLNLKDAQVKAAAESGITRDQFGENLRAMGIFTRTEIDLMMKEFDRLDGRTIDTTINVNLKGRGASTFSDTISGKKAAGGPVASGGTYLVGERGPELLQMGSSNGNIVPNSQLGGTTSVVLQNHGVIGSQREFENWLVRSLETAKRRGRISG